ncbi:MAG TPA: lysylphosphatidylglycerol synthase domain-containing protein [Casimicrobiaceae bacterium]|nr:lysylphosphatidylglycerol synthase domain-containing protein [Casimicrobiaceae bacterium]
MRHAAGVLALAGLALAVVLFARSDVGALAALLVAAGPGLLLASLFHVVPMIANAHAWQLLLPVPQRPDLRTMTRATWIRESVNGLLPVARIGGEIVAYRIVRSQVERRSDAAASLIADMTLSVLSQAGFALFGLSLLFANHQRSVATRELLMGVAVMIAFGGGFLLAQRRGALVRVFNRLFAGRLAIAHWGSLRFEEALRAVYSRHRDIAACAAWQLAGWVLGSGEIWIALHFLGRPRSAFDAMILEALIQAVSSAAFMVPAALGVQEGAFVLVGAALGIDATTALALATARRLRDVVVFFPGLLAWQRAETRMREARSTGGARQR